MSKKSIGYIITFIIVVGLLGIMIKCINIQEDKVTVPQFTDKSKMIVINEVLSDNMGGLQDEDGDYNDWIEIYNYGDEKVNLLGYGLSDDLDEPYKWVFPDIEIGEKSFVVIMASGKDKKDNHSFLHTNFKLNKDGEFVILSHPDGETIDSIKVSMNEENISYGRTADGYNDYATLSKSTPGGPNNVSILNKVVPERRLETPIFSKEGGFYDDTIYLELAVEDKDTKIFYTLDGSEPSTSSYLYKNPIEVSSREGEPNKLSNIKTTEQLGATKVIGEEEVYKGTVVRARTYKDGIISDEIITNTYFINPNYTLPIISLVTDEDNLFGYNDGIYVPGRIYDNWIIRNRNIESSVSPVPTNYNQRGIEWEREGHIEFFEPNGYRGIAQNIGIRISGAWSRQEPCKSLNIYARKEYDSNNTIEYNLFPGLEDNEINKNELSSFKTITLRNSGNDFNQTMFKDALQQSLVSDIGIDTQAYRPAILFINGEYWGIHNIRERYTEDYFDKHYGIEKSDLAVLEIIQDVDGKEKMGVSIGSQKDIDDYNKMIDFIEKNDMSIYENYKIIEDEMDIDNFIKYTVAQIYFSNLDWPQNNVKVWRATESNEEGIYHDGKWRWSVYDVDAGFTDYKDNTLLHAINTNFFDLSLEDSEKLSDKNNEEKEIRDRCIPLERLLQNEEFKMKFLNTFNEYLNTIFNSDNVVNKIDEMAKVIEPEIEEHLSRWEMKDNFIGVIWNKIENEDSTEVVWKDEVEKLKVFAVNRPSYIREYLDEYFK